MANSDVGNVDVLSGLHVSIHWPMIPTFLSQTCTRVGPRDHRKPVAADSVSWWTLPFGIISTQSSIIAQFPSSFEFIQRCQQLQQRCCALVNHGDDSQIQMFCVAAGPIGQAQHLGWAAGGDVIGQSGILSRTWLVMIIETYCTTYRGKKQEYECYPETFHAVTAAHAPGKQQQPGL